MGTDTHFFVFTGYVNIILTRYDHEKERHVRAQVRSLSRPTRGSTQAKIMINQEISLFKINA